MGRWKMSCPSTCLSPSTKECLCPEEPRSSGREGYTLTPEKPEGAETASAKWFNG